MCKIFLSIQRYADGGAGAPGGDGNAAAAAQQTGETTVTQDAAANGPAVVEAEKAPAADKTQAFEQLIKGEYREEFAKRTQELIDKRFAKAKASEEQLAALSPLVEMLQEKYGTDAKDPAALVKAVLDDDSYYEAEAMQKGIDVKQLKEIKRIERENAELRRVNEQRSRQAAQGQAYAQLMHEADEAKKFYPSFELEKECENASFMRMIRAGVDAKTAYEVAHKDEIIGGAMQYTAQQVAQKVTSGLQAKASRPPENGAAGNGAAQTSIDVNKLTREGRRELIARARAGERISF